MKANIYVTLSPNCIEFPQNSFSQNIFTKPLFYEIILGQHLIVGENLFFTVPIIKLRMFGGYISVMEF